MILTRVIVTPTRRVRDLLRNKRFKAVRRFPGGREIELGSAATRARATKIAETATRPNGSPTAGGVDYTPGYAPGSNDGDSEIITQYR